MEGNKAGVGVVIIIAVVVALSFSFVLTTPSGSTPIKIPSNPKYTNTTYLWADANGWNTGHGPVNPVLNYSTGTVVTFIVTEEDTQPHTLTINAGGNPSNPQAGENGNNATTILSTSQITVTKGHVSQAQFYFANPGIYTYWCIIHKTTMVGVIYVNGSAVSSSVSSSAPQTSFSGALNINPGLTFTKYSDMATISSTNGGTLEL